eukprot:TRINITY_DN9535_c0_g1_i6.p1 TRINITY_DN9535_c0_g1~~TRINITY_DN9535_c0_g1_i6.p1  ORF type:complete len:123 (-),score=5.67 TRINITY_DN9535_c0_g1_i6:32-400(-)
MESVRTVWSECKEIFDSLSGEAGHRPSPQLQSSLQSLALSLTRRVLDLGRDQSIIRHAMLVPKVQELQRHIAAMVRAISPVATSGAMISTAVIPSSRKSFLGPIAPSIQTLVTGLGGHVFPL